MAPIADAEIREGHGVTPQTLVTGGIPLLEAALPLPVSCAISILPPMRVTELGLPTGSRSSEDIRAVALEVRQRLQNRLNELAAR